MGVSDVVLVPLLTSNPLAWNVSSHQHPASSPVALPSTSIWSETASMWARFFQEEGFLRTLALALFFSTIFTTIAIAYVELTYRGTRALYFAGKLKRYYPLNSDRQLKRNLMGAGAFIGPSVFTYFFVFPDPMTYDFRPLEILGLSLVYMLWHDSWFYQLHVHSHKNRFAYEHLHKLHHEYVESLSVFMTAYGTLAENFLDVGCGWMGFIAILHVLNRMNFWTIVMPFTFATLTTILGHAGYASSPLFALFHPMMIFFYPIRTLLLTPGDHQAHHLLRRCNYGLFFRFNDKWHGTYRKFTSAKPYDAKYWVAKVKAGEGMRGKLAADHKSRELLPYEELERTAEWGF